MSSEFFAYARERQTILLRKNAGRPREEWTDDKILSYYKFCNVFREDDRTTIWLRQNVDFRGPELLLATIVFRWFNRIETGEAIFTDRNLLGDGRTAWEHFVEQRSVEPLRAAILKGRGAGPYVTGAYCIIGMPHMSKLEGVLACIENVLKMPSPTDIIPGFTSVWYRDLANHLYENRHVPLERVWDWLRRFPRSGDFMAYEVVTDLNNTWMMRDAPDKMTWANAGPGAIRGLNRIHERIVDAHRNNKTEQNQEMLDLLTLSRMPEFWPQDWPMWDMRTVEHTLCEFDKYNRIHEGGRVKGVYR